MSKNILTNKTILITGAAGSIGSALSKKISLLSPKLLVILDQDETGIFDLYEEIKNVCNVDYVIASIRDYGKILEVFREYKPDIVYHAAAYKHVVLMERFKEEAIATNIIGLGNVVKSAVEVGVKKFIFISSDKAVNPTSTMGWTKSQGEKMCLKEKGMTKFIIVRFGNVMPSRGSVVPIFQKQISENRNLTITHPKMKRYFMGIYEAVNLVIKATQKGKHGDIIVLDMGDPIYITDLAKTMIKLSGKPLEIIYTQPNKGEKFNEELMTKKERSRAKKVDGMYIINGRK